jgi:hypothetical protein
MVVAKLLLPPGVSSSPLLPSPFLKLVSLQRSYFCARERDSSPLYSRRLHVRVTASLGASALAAAVATGEEADDDAAELDNGADDGLEDAADTADNGHDGISDGLETRLDARDNTAHFG